MRRILFCCLTVFVFFRASSQSPAVESILKEPEVRIPYYEMEDAGGWVLYLPMEFGKSVFSMNQEAALSRLKDAQVLDVDLVYSDFPANQDFTALSRKRLESLRLIQPELFSNPEIRFRKLRQTIAKTQKTAQGLQHGFFIYFRPKPGPAETKKEISEMKSMAKTGALDEAMPDTSADAWKKYMYCGLITVTVDTSYLHEVKDSSSYGWLNPPPSVPHEIKKWAVKEYIKSKLQPEIKEADYKDWDSLYRIVYKGECPDAGTDYYLYHTTDSTVSSVLKRHNWKNALVLADVTGSMYPYTAQLLQWLKISLTDKKQRHFLFFNDGDEKADAEKRIGSTGGLYPVFSSSYDEVEKTIVTAMTHGSGGDIPENNMEALLKGVSLCPACDSVVLIADNWAPVKDISLLSSLHKPVKVILCGVMGPIQKDYLKLVRDTGGSLHLIEEDIYNLAEVSEGQTIKIHGINYILIKGEFKPVTSSRI